MKRFRRQFGAITASLVIAGGLAVVAAAPPAGAATFAVTNTKDAGPGSLRQAVLDAVAANANSTIEVSDELEGKTINLTTGELDFTPAGDPSLKIEGNGVEVHQATPANAVLFSPKDGELTLEDITITGGRGPGNGGGVAAAGPVTVIDSEFRDNIVSGTLAVGGAVFSLTVVTAIRSTFEDNQSISTTSQASGGAIAGGFDFGQLGVRLIDSTVTDNSIQGAGNTLYGGGIVANGVIELIRSTVAHNEAHSTAPVRVEALGGGVTSFSAVHAVNSTVTDNTLTRAGSVASDEVFGGGIAVQSCVTGITGCTQPSGGAIALTYADVVDNAAPEGANLSVSPFDSGAGPATVAESGEDGRSYVFGEASTESAAADADTGPVSHARTLVAFASVITDPGGGGDNCDGFKETDSSGYNYADDDSCDLDEKTDSEHESNEPLLGDLHDNGGETPTLLPQADSPLVNAIPPDDCDADEDDVDNEDQRELPRPGADDPRCDIGAVELEALPVEVPIVIEPTFTG